MDADKEPPHPRLAILVAAGEVVDVPDDSAGAIIAAEPVARHEVLPLEPHARPRWRLILIDGDLVDRIIERWPQPR
jgi:hypothetical protein